MSEIGVWGAGPWASQVNSYLPEPDPLNAVVLPVNCANYNAGFWPWICVSRYFDTSVGQQFEIAAPIGGSINVIRVGRLNAGPNLSLRWRYQSMNTHTISVSYHAVSSVSATTMQAQFLVDGTTVFMDTQNDVSFITGTQSITLPPATVPKPVIISILAGNPSLTNLCSLQLAFDLDPLP